MTKPIKLGFLYPGHSAEDDLPRLAARLNPPVEAVVVHTSVGEDAHRVDALLDVGRSERLLAGARALKDQGIAAACWACTSGSFVFGLEGARQQAQEIQDYLGMPVSSTSLAFADALVAMDIRKVAVVATYPDDVAQRFSEFLCAGGTEVLSVAGIGIITAAEVGTLAAGEMMDLIEQGDHPDADAVLVPDTALHSVAWLDRIEARLGKPVITANQVTLWQTLRLAGELTPQTGLGALFMKT